MKERLIQLLDLEQLSPSKFADIIGVQRSSISHVISGRNKPSFDFLQKTLKAFPGLNASWLMLGEGTMYEQMGRNISGNLFETTDEGPREAVNTPESFQEIDVTGADPSKAGPDTVSLKEEGEPGRLHSGELEREDSTPPHTAPASTDSRKIVQVMVIYEDDTFRTFAPAQ